MEQMCEDERIENEWKRRAPTWAHMHLVLCHQRRADTFKLEREKTKTSKLLTDITTASPAARYILQLLIASQQWIKFWIKGVGMKIQRYRR